MPRWVQLGGVRPVHRVCAPPARLLSRRDGRARGEPRRLGSAVRRCAVVAVVTPMEEVLQRLEAERYGPVVRQPDHVPHMPLDPAGAIDMLRELDAAPDADSYLE